MPRIDLPAPDRMDPEQRRVHDQIVSGRRGRIQGPLRAVLHNAELADRWQALGALLRYRTSLTPRQSELAILVTGRACRSPFEWHAHRLEAEKAGIEAAVIEALLAEHMPDGLSDDEALVVRVAVELNRMRSVSDATYAETVAQIGERGVIDLVGILGYYAKWYPPLWLKGLTAPFAFADWGRLAPQLRFIERDQSVVCTGLVVVSVLAFVLPILFAVLVGAVAFAAIGILVWWFKSRRSSRAARVVGTAQPVACVARAARTHHAAT